MTSFAWVKPVIVLAPLLALGIPQAVPGEELINRRDQARRAFLATPQSLYVHYCAHCHGEDATGGGRLWVAELPSSPADLTALGADKEYVIAVIRNGSAAHGKSNLCPPWGRTISLANQERLAQYIVSLDTQTSQPASQPAASPEPVREPFPWFLLAAVLGEIFLLWAVLRRRKEVSTDVPQDSPLHG